MLKNQSSQTYFLCLCILLFALAVAGQQLVRPKVNASAHVSAARVPGVLSAAQGAASESRRLIRIWVHRTSIYPSFLRITPGRVNLRVENETQFDKGLVVERVLQLQPRQQLANVRVVNGEVRADKEMVLEAGDYVYYEESAPELIGHLLVAPEL
jgi:hypothetical protein